MDDVIEKIRRTIERHRMLDDGDRVVVALSGGPDSMALLGALARLAPDYRLTLIAAHLNHGLRGERADEEEAFVRRVGRDMGLICESRKADIGEIGRQRKTSIEETAREERYRFLETVRDRRGARKIALGHHRRDQAETVLMNLLRGSGAEGLRGMRPLREGLYIRPLIDLSREEIMAFLRRENLPFLVDDSNRDLRYLRNRIRHRLLPALERDYNPRLEETLCRTAEIMRLEDDWMQGEVRRLIADRRIVAEPGEGGEIAIRIPAFLRLHEALQNRLIKHLLLRGGEAAKGVGYDHVREVRHFMDRPRPSGFLHLPFGVELRREYDLLMIGRRRRHPRAGRKDRRGGERGGVRSGGGAASAAWEVTVPGIVPLVEAGVSLRFDLVERQAVRFNRAGAVFLDYGRVEPPLTVRFPRPGDRIQPLGMAGTQKVKDLFIDRKIPLRIRRRVPLLADARSVVWVAGHRLSERVKVTEQTTRILKIEMI